VEADMSTKKVVENFQTLLKELDVTGPDERWKAIRQLANLSLRMSTLQMLNEKEGGDSGLTEEDWENAKKAIELRQEVCRRLKQMRKLV
jgi:hypothetical protein